MQCLGRLYGCWKGAAQHPVLVEVGQRSCIAGVPIPSLSMWLTLHSEAADCQKGNGWLVMRASRLRGVKITFAYGFYPWSSSHRTGCARGCPDSELTLVSTSS